MTKVLENSQKQKGWNIFPHYFSIEVSTYLGEEGVVVGSRTVHIKSFRTEWGGAENRKWARLYILKVLLCIRRLPPRLHLLKVQDLSQADSLAWETKCSWTWAYYIPQTTSFLQPCPTLLPFTPSWQWHHIMNISVKKPIHLHQSCWALSLLEIPNSVSS